jgi:uroporphyrinogen-III decarboxylase
MTSRERILQTLRGGIPDRVPLSLYEFDGYYDAWITGDASYAASFRYVAEGITDLFKRVPVPEISNWPFNVVESEETKWQEADAQFSRTTLHTPKGPLTQKTRRDQNIHTTWVLEHWLKNTEDIARWMSIPSPGLKFDTALFAREDEKLGARGIPMPDIADAICQVADLLGFSTLLEMLVVEPVAVSRLMDFEQERVLEHARAIATAAQQHDCIVRLIGPEYATPPYMSPAFFKKLVVDYDQPICDILHAAGIYVRLHSHGKIGQVLHLIAGMQPDALDPLEPPPDGDIELDHVKRKIGDKITLIGNIELRFIEHWKPAEIDQYVQKVMEQAKTAGRFVLCPTAMPIHTPLEAKISDNIIAMVEAGLKYGKY